MSGLVNGRILNITDRGILHDNLVSRVKYRGTVAGVMGDKITHLQPVASAHMREVCVISRGDICRLGDIGQETVVLGIEDEK